MDGGSQGNAGAVGEYKRLEKEKFKWLRRCHSSVMSLSEDEWLWLLSGDDIEGPQALQLVSFTG